MTADVSLSPKVLELMASRICHDLISPVTAINNGIELAEELGPEGVGDAMELIAQSGKQASAKLQCLRLAYGAAGSGSNILLGEIKTVFEGFLEGARTELSWPDTALQIEDAPAGFAKCVLNALLLLSESGAHAATITIAVAGSTVTLSVAGKGVKFRDGAKEALTGEVDVDTLDPRTVHAYLTGKFAAHYGVTLACPIDEDGQIDLTLGF